MTKAKTQAARMPGRVERCLAIAVVLSEGYWPLALLYIYFTFRVSNASREGDKSR